MLVAEDGGHWKKFEPSSYIMRGKFWVNNHAHVLKAKEDITTNLYLTHVLNYMDLSIYVGGDARGKINQGTLKSIKIPLPPLDEQKKIANILSTIDQKIEKEENRKKALNELFNSMLNNLMTGKIRVNNLNFK